MSEYSPSFLPSCSHIFLDHPSRGDSVAAAGRGGFSVSGVILKERKMTWSVNPNAFPKRRFISHSCFGSKMTLA